VSQKRPIVRQTGSGLDLQRFTQERLLHKSLQKQRFATCIDILVLRR
jgi:hypothetical protein